MKLTNIPDSMKIAVVADKMAETVLQGIKQQHHIEKEENECGVFLDGDQFAKTGTALAVCQTGR